MQRIYPEVSEILSHHPYINVLIDLEYQKQEGPHWRFVIDVVINQIDGEEGGGSYAEEDERFWQIKAIYTFCY